MIKVFKENDKLVEAYDKLVEFIENLVEEYQLNYFEIFGILQCLNNDIFKSSFGEEE